MMQSRKIFLSLFGMAVFLFMSAASCTRVDADILRSEVITLPDDIRLTFSTKTDGGGVYTDTTFRFCLFNSTTHNFSGFEGTYCSPNPAKDSRWLTPCKVDGTTGAYDSGAADPEATINGLQARNGTYCMAIASPAVAMQSPKKDVYGFYYSRERTPGVKTLCISDSIEVAVAGVSINGCNLYFVNDTIHLKERRSKFRLSVSCGDDIESAIVKEVKLANVLAKGYYLPADMEFEYEDSYLEDVTVESYTPAITLYQEDNPDAGRPKHRQCLLEPCVLSMDYSKVDEYGHPRFPLPEIVIALGEDGGKEVRIPVAYNLLPENIYNCHITVNSSYVQVYFSVLDWDGPNNVSGDNASYYQRPSTITVSIWDNGISGTDGDTEIHDTEW